MDPWLLDLISHSHFKRMTLPIEEINAPNTPLTNEEREQIVDTFRANISQAWRVTSDELSFSPVAKKAILKASTELYAQFKNTQIPLATNDLKKKLARETISLALLCGRTTATREDVAYVVREVSQVYRKLGLGNRVSEPKPEATEWLAYEMTKDPNLASVVTLLRRGGKFTQKEVSKEIEVDPRTAKRKLDALHVRGFATLNGRNWSATPLLRKMDQLAA